MRKNPFTSTPYGFLQLANQSPPPLGTLNLTLQPAQVITSPHTAQQTKRTRSNTSNGQTCSKCGTGETPEWRRGPDGQVSLCNACGLTYQKAKKKARIATKTEQPLLPQLFPHTLYTFNGQLVPPTANPQQSTQLALSTSVNNTIPVVSMPMHCPTQFLRTNTMPLNPAQQQNTRQPDPIPLSMTPYFPFPVTTPVFIRTQPAPLQRDPRMEIANLLNPVEPNPQPATKIDSTVQRLKPAM